ncbi:MAG: hypothetical protein E7348_04705 [Clostridiales bacterium]|nr:hypothetical protein [Clostridiales bacterium]
MTNKYPLNTRQVCFFIIAFLPITKIFSLPSLIANISREDMWLSILISLVLDFITLIPIIIACKNARKGFIELLEDTVGKKISKLILFLYLIYFIFKAIIPINEQKDYVDYTLYTLRPSYAYFLPFFVLAFYICFKRLQVLGRISDILWIVSINGLITLFVLSISNADFSAILPIGASGISKILSGTYNALSWFGDSVFIMFFIGEFKFEKRSTIKILLSFLLGALFVLLFMIIFYSIFTSIAFRQRFALTEISKYTTVISNLGRFDYIGIIMVLFSNVFALCLPMYFCSKIIDHLFNIKKQWISPTISVCIQLIIMLTLSEYFVSVQNFIINYVGVYFIFLANVLPIIISLLSLKEKTYEIEKG